MDVMSRFSFELYEDPIVSPTETQVTHPFSEVAEQLVEETVIDSPSSTLFEAPAVVRPLLTLDANPTLPTQLEEKLAQFAPSRLNQATKPTLIPSRTARSVEIPQSSMFTTSQERVVSRLPVKQEPQDAFELVSALDFEEEEEDGIQQPSVKTLLEQPFAQSDTYDTGAILDSLDTAYTPASKAPSVRSRAPWKSLAFYAVLFLLPIGVAGGINVLSTAPGLGGAPSAKASELVSALPPGENIAPAGSQTTQSEDLQRAKLASANTSDKSVEYELSLSASFLRKAVQMSNTTTNQTAEDKNRIIGLLNQSLEAANRAIQASPTDPRAYTTRGRVYQATSIVKPEMKAMADADFAKAKELGSANPTDMSPTANPLELLPTEQAKARETAMIAGPSTATKQTVTAETTNTANKGTAIMPAGQKEVFVEFPALKDNTQVYIKPEGDVSGTYFIKNKQTGKGFTVATTEAPVGATTLSWWEIL